MCMCGSSLVSFCHLRDVIDFVFYKRPVSVRNVSLSLSPAVLDMARHVPLYRALLELLRAISTCTSLVPLLLPLSGDAAEEEEDEERTECQTSVGMLLAKMKTCVDTYTNRLR